MKPQYRVTVYGGDARLSKRLTAPGIDLVVLPSESKRYRKALLKQLRAKDTSLAVLLPRWLDHTDYHNAVDACKAAGVPFIAVPAAMGQSAIQRMLDELSVIASEARP